MKFEEYQDNFHGNKFGIDAKIGTNTKHYRHCSFTVTAGGESRSITSSLSDGKGKSLGSLDFFEDKFNFDELVGVELFDAIETTINQYIDGSISYTIGLFNHDKLEPIELSAVKKICLLVYSMSKRLDVGFNYPHNLKSKKAIGIATREIHSVLLKIASLNRYESVFTITPHTVRPYNDRVVFFDNYNVSVDAENYFDGSFEEMLIGVTNRQNQAVLKAETKGKSLLMGLAHGDIAVNDFDSKS